MEINPIYKFATEAFIYEGEVYNLVVTPELYSEEDGLDFTGSYVGILIHPLKGTIDFTMTPDRNTRWEIDKKHAIHPGLIDEIAKVIKKHFKN